VEVTQARRATNHKPSTPALMPSAISAWINVVMDVTNMYLDNWASWMFVTGASGKEHFTFIFTLASLVQKDI
jgi:hypothetical protein